MKTKLFSTVIVGLSLLGCNLGESYGYVPTHAEIRQIQPGVDNKSSIQERFGPPTVIGETESVWYYVSSKRSYPGPLPTIETERRVLALRFEGDRLAGVSEFGQEEGQSVAISRYTTETGGRELTLWQQLYGSVGNFSAESFLDAAVDDGL